MCSFWSSILDRKDNEPRTCFHIPGVCSPLPSQHENSCSKAQEQDYVVSLLRGDGKPWTLLSQPTLILIHLPTDALVIVLRDCSTQDYALPNILAYQFLNRMNPKDLCFLPVPTQSTISLSGFTAQVYFVGFPHRLLLQCPNTVSLDLPADDPACFLCLCTCCPLRMGYFFYIFVCECFFSAEVSPFQQTVIFKCFNISIS